MAGGAVFQVAQTASQNQEILGYYQKRCENPDLLRYHYLLFGCHSPKGPEARKKHV